MSVREVIDDKTKDICNLLDATICFLKSYLDNGLEQADTREVGEVTDIIKDMSETYSNIIKGIYHKTITEAMEESGARYGTDYDYQGIRWYTNTHKVGGMSEHMRDMDRDEGRMYFAPTDDMRSGKSAHSRVRYYDTKSDHMTNSVDDVKAKKESMEEYMDDIYDDIEEMLMGESTEMKSMARQKLISMANAM